MVEDGEARGREEPWLHMGILQGVHWVGIHFKEFWLNFKIQVLWPCECDQWQPTPICDDVFQIHAWNPAYAWVRSCVPFRDGASDLGQAQAWRVLAHLLIQGHRESGRFFGCGMGWEIRFQEGKQILSQEGTPRRGMELRARCPKREKAQTFLRLGVQTQRQLCQKRGSFQREPTQRACRWEAQRGMFQLQQSGALLQRLPQT